MIASRITGCHCLRCHRHRYCERWWSTLALIPLTVGEVSLPVAYSQSHGELLIPVFSPSCVHLLQLCSSIEKVCLNINTQKTKTPKARRLLRLCLLCCQMKKHTIKIHWPRLLLLLIDCLEKFYDCLLFQQVTL